MLRAESQLHAMLPAVDALHTGAGDSLRATLNSVEPRMHGLIERLELVAGIDAIRAPQAAEAAETLRRRLGQGALAYDRLIDATATLLAAPDPAGTATDSLAIATAELRPTPPASAPRPTSSTSTERVRAVVSRPGLRGRPWPASCVPLPRTAIRGIRVTR